jgi:hypothetical protein
VLRTVCVVLLRVLFVMYRVGDGWKDRSQK